MKKIRELVSPYEAGMVNVDRQTQVIEKLNVVIRAVNELLPGLEEVRVDPDETIAKDKLKEAYRRDLAKFESMISEHINDCEEFYKAALTFRQEIFDEWLSR